MESLPLDTLSEVLHWVPPKSAFKSNEVNVCRSSKFLDGAQWTERAKDWDWLVKHPLKDKNKTKPRTLMCHDMMGGYIEDRFLSPVQKDSYSFLHWSHLDIFVYFSHHFVTIPPPGWVRAAKIHGVTILGTIITEWDEGKKLLEEILSDEEKMRNFVEKCGEIAEFHGFDGWLLNIENPVELELVPKLLDLVRLLRDRMKKIREDCLVLWYDSVTTQGKLEWQDEVNLLNKPFLDNCDGIFLNYTWKTPETSDPPKDSLENSVQAVAMDSRRTDIFVGVDVFGRGCLGGGGFNCDQALAKIRKKGLSCAIFAPGWTYELPHRENTVARDFFLREHMFWALLEKYLYFHALKIQSTTRVGGGEVGGGGGETPGECSEMLRKAEFTLVFRSCFYSGRGADRFHLLAVQPQPSLPSFNLQHNKECPGLDGLPPEKLQNFSPSAITYCCHTNTKGYEDSQSLYLSVRQLGSTVPLFLVDLCTPDQLLFVLDVAEKRGEPEPEKDSETEPKKDDGDREPRESMVLDVVLGLDDGTEIVLKEVDKAENPSCSTVLQNNKENCERKGFLLQNCRRTIEKIGLRPRNVLHFYLGQFSIYASQEL